MTYQDYAAPFVAAGFRVVLYDQYGRGFSDRPRAPFSIDLMRAQLAELMDHLRLSGLIFTAYRWAGRLSHALRRASRPGSNTGPASAADWRGQCFAQYAAGAPAACRAAFGTVLRYSGDY